MKNIILTGLIALVTGGIIGWFLHTCKPEVKFLPAEIKTEFRDTCIKNSLIANVVTEAITTKAGSIKKGSTIKDSSTFPIEEVAVQDTDVVTTFNKSYNSGLMKMNVKVKVTAKSAAKAKIDFEYQLDTVVLKEMTTIVNTILIDRDSTDVVPTEVIKYVPFETAPKKMTYLGIGGLVTKNPKQYNYAAGLSLSHGKTSVSLFKDPTRPLKSLDGYSIGINRQLIRMSAK